MLTDVPNEDLAKMSKEKAVALVEELVHIDAGESGIPLDIISFSSETDTPDGGIDGMVNGSDRKSKTGAIKEGITCYQIKSGGQRPIPSTIRKILRTNDGRLKPGIKNCFDKGGTLVVVFTGVDTPVQKISEICDQSEKHIPEYKNPRLEIWVQSNLRQFLKPHPRLSLKILGIDDELFCPYQEWAGQEYMRNSIFLGPAQRKLIHALEQGLPRTSTKHIRITGEPGIGKTRLVLEALRAKFSDSCLYTDNPVKFAASDLFRYIRTSDDKSPIILVVDDCDESEMVAIWNKVKHTPQISLITIYNESGTRMRDITMHEVPPLEDKQIINILESYTSPHNAKVWCNECRPSPRAAHIVGENLKDSQDDILQPPSDMRVWDRYIASQAELDSPEFNERKKILLWLSLFKRFGERESHPAEYTMIEKTLKDKIGVTPATLSQTISKLKRMKVLQGSSVLYITPKVVHIWLWRQWHKEYDRGLFPLDEIVSRAKTDTASGNMLEWYMDMIKYAEDEPGVKGVTDDLFKPNGFADKHALLDSHEGADLFYSVSKADPKKAVDYLYRHVDAMGKVGLSGFNAGRMQATMLVSEAAMDSRFFERSARMLLLLAGTESDQEFSDTYRLFVGLFSPFPGPVVWTAMPPSGRLPIIAEALESEIPKCRLLGIQACEAALQTRNSGYVDDGVWQRVKPWMPRFRSECTEYYSGVLDIIREYLERLEMSERSKLAGVVLSRARDLLGMHEMHDAMLSLLDVVCDKQYADGELIIETVSNCLAYGRDGMPEDLRKNLERLRDKTAGSSYGALLKRYVAMNIASDREDGGRVRQNIAKLAKQSLGAKKLGSELDWLVTDKAVYGHVFGRALGKLDGGVLFSRICDAQRRHGESNAVFLGGYLSAVFLKDKEVWECLMDSLVEDPVLSRHIPALTHMSGMTDRAAARIRDLVRAGLGPTALKDFQFGTLVRDMSEERFGEWLQLLADGSARTYDIALGLYYRYYVHDNMRIPDSAKNLLSWGIEMNCMQRVSGIPAHCWSDILAAYVKQNPDEWGIIGKVLKMATNTSYLCSSLYDGLLPTLMIAAERDPARTWKMISGAIYPAGNGHGAYRTVNGLLSMNDAALVGKISFKVIFQWIDRDKERRAPLVARQIPNDINTAVRFAAKYGKIKRVTRTLAENLNSEPANVPMLKYYARKIKEVDSLMEKEKNSGVLDFLREYKNVLLGRKGSVV